MRITLTILLAMLASCGKLETRYVIAPSGLNLRSTPSAAGAPLGLIPAGAAVTLLEEHKDLSSWQGLSGHWTRVRYNNADGWVFGAFLSNQEPPRIVGARWDECPDIGEHYGLTFYPNGTFIGDGISGASSGTYKMVGDQISVLYDTGPRETVSFVQRPDGRLCSEQRCFCR